MKKLLVVLLALVILGVGTAFGDRFDIKDNTLVKYYGSGGVVTVPEGITELGESAFEGSPVTKVILPETLKEIRSYCFSNCYELEEITLPASLENMEVGGGVIQAQVFAYNSSLKAINVAEGNTHYTSVDGVLFTADRKTLLYYPDGKETEIYFIPEGTKELGVSAFCAPEKLTSIVLPATLTGVENSSCFSCIPNLKSIIASYEHSEYRTVNGVLYDNSGKLISYPIGKTDERLEKDDFPKGVYSIGPWAFQYAGNIKAVELPESVTYLGWMSFSRMESLESITIPASVQVIESYAFDNCKNLKRVTILNPKTMFDQQYSILDGSPYAVLYGYENSTTQVYAEKWNIKFESLGEAPGKGN